MDVNKVTVRTTEFRVGDVVELKPILGNQATRYYIIVTSGNAKSAHGYCYVNLEAGTMRCPSGTLSGLLAGCPPVCLVDYIELKR